MQVLRIAAMLATLASTTAFLVPVPSSRQSTSLFAEVDIKEDRKINSKIDLESPKVVNTIKLEAGEKKVFCRCWLSGTFPLCNGAHAKHNEKTGDNVGPLIVSAPKPE